MDFSLRELECFIAIAEELSFIRAARRLNLTQPPLTRHLRALEEKVGVQLVVRGSRRSALTTAGQQFYEDVCHIPTKLLEAADHARRCASGETTRLRLGAVSAALNVGLLETFRKFREEFPEVQIQLVDAPPAEQLQAILEGKLDGGFVGVAPLESPVGIHYTPCFTESLDCFVPAGHPLSTKRRISLAELAPESFIALSSKAAPAFSAFVRGLCREAGFTPRVILEASRTHAVASMVAAGSGIALLPAAVIDHVGSSVIRLGLKERPILRHVFAHVPGTPNQVLDRLLQMLSKMHRRPKA